MLLLRSFLEPLPRTYSTFSSSESSLNSSIDRVLPEASFLARSTFDSGTGYMYSFKFFILFQVSEGTSVDSSSQLLTVASLSLFALVTT